MTKQTTHMKSSTHKQRLTATEESPWKGQYKKKKKKKKILGAGGIKIGFTERVAGWGGEIEPVYSSETHPLF